MQPFLSLLPLIVCFHQIPGVGADASSVCGPCNKETCSPVTCVAPELLTKDECNCCEQCLSIEGEVCGGRDEMRARCAPRMVCVSRSSSGSDSSSSEGTGVCVCEEDGAVCGSDGRTYSSVCTLHLHSWKSQHSGAGSVHKVHDGECTFAPIIIVTPQKIHNVTGAQVYLSCEVKAVPTPSISWRKVTESPKGIKIFEELPGDRVNVAVQVRGGPSRHESTGWVLINPLMKEDEGTYQCHATNMVGEAFADGTIKVSVHSSRRSRKSHRSSSESKV